jgi:hypothetical protein
MYPFRRGDYDPNGGAEHWRAINELDELWSVICEFFEDIYNQALE